MKWAPILLEQMKKLPGFTEVNTDQQNHGLQASLVYDRPDGGAPGHPPQMWTTPCTMRLGRRRFRLCSPAEPISVVMEVAPQFWQGPEGLRRFICAHQQRHDGAAGAVAHYLPTTAPIAVNHQGQFPAVTISFNLVPGLSLSDAVQGDPQMEQEIKMPSIHGSFCGHRAAFQQSLGNESFLISPRCWRCISCWASCTKVTSIRSRFC